MLVLFVVVIIIIEIFCVAMHHIVVAPSSMATTPTNLGDALHSSTVVETIQGLARTAIMDDPMFIHTEVESALSDILANAASISLANAVFAETITSDEGSFGWLSVASNSVFVGPDGQVVSYIDTGEGQGHLALYAIDSSAPTPRGVVLRTDGQKFYVVPTHPHNGEGWDANLANSFWQDLGTGVVNLGNGIQTSWIGAGGEILTIDAPKGVKIGDVVMTNVSINAPAVSAATGVQTPLLQSVGGASLGIVAPSTTFSGSVSGVTTLAAGNVTATGAIRANGVVSATTGVQTPLLQTSSPLGLLVVQAADVNMTGNLSVVSTVTSNNIVATGNVVANALAVAYIKSSSSSTAAAAAAIQGTDVSFMGNVSVGQTISAPAVRATTIAATGGNNLTVSAPTITFLTSGGAGGGGNVVVTNSLSSNIVYAQTIFSNNIFNMAGQSWSSSSSSSSLSANLLVSNALAVAYIQSGANARPAVAISGTNVAFAGNVSANVFTGSVVVVDRVVANSISIAAAAAGFGGGGGSSSADLLVANALAVSYIQSGSTAAPAATLRGIDVAFAGNVQVSQGTMYANNVVVAGTSLNTLISTAVAAGSSGGVGNITSTTGTLTVGNLVVGNLAVTGGIVAGGRALRTTSTRTLPTALGWAADFSMMVYADGSVWGTGDGSKAQLAPGDRPWNPWSASNQCVWTQIRGLSNVVKVVCGKYHVVALLADGSVWAWGSNLAGQVGVGLLPELSGNPQYPKDSTWPWPSPVLVIPAGAVNIAASSNQSGAVMADGTIRVWGSSTAINPLGNAALMTMWTPWQPPNVRGAVHLVLGNTAAYALLADGTVLTTSGTPSYTFGRWSSSSYNTTTTASAVVHVAAGGAGPPVMVFADGTVYTGGMLANDSSVSNVLQLEVGRAHAVALLSNGSVVTFGSNDSGQLGNGGAPTLIANTAQATVGIVGSVVAVAAGNAHTLVLTDAGDVYMAGLNVSGQLGLGFFGNTTASSGFVLTGRVVGLGNIALGPFAQHGVIAFPDGTAWATGADGTGQLGFSSPTTANAVNTWTQIPGLGNTHVAKAVCGADHTLALATDGSVWAWGGNGRGQLGTGTFVASNSTPTRVLLPGTAVDVVAGNLASGAITVGGSALVWGKAGGLGALQAQSLPAQPSWLASSVFGCVSANLSVLAGLGSASTSNASLAANVLALASVQASVVKAGNVSVPWPAFLGGLYGKSKLGSMAQHSMLIDQTGTLWATGNNSKGQLGIGNTTNMNVWTQVPGISNVVQVACGGYQTVALCVDQSVWAWGDSVLPSSYIVTSVPYSGGSLGSSFSPVQILPGSSSLFVTAGINGPVGVVTIAGNLVVWGPTSTGVSLGTIASQNITAPWDTGVSGMASLLIGTFGCYALTTSGYMWTTTDPSGGSHANGDWVADQGIDIGQNNIPSPYTSTYLDICGSTTMKIGNNVVSVPVPVFANGVCMALGAPSPTIAVSNVMQIACGRYHVLAMLGNGSVLTWGENNYGQLGTGSIDYANLGSNWGTSKVSSATWANPQLVTGLGPGNAIAVAAGEYHSMITMDTGAVYMAGCNVDGRLGLGAGAAVNVATFTLAYQFPPLRCSQLALGDGTAYMLQGGLGAVSTTVGAVAPAIWTSYPGLSSNVVQLAPAGNVLVALFGNGSVFTDAAAATGSPLALPSGLLAANVVSIASGTGHVAALTANGTVLSFGQNDAGQLGAGLAMGSSSSTPVAAVGIVGKAIAIAAGNAHTLVFTAAGDTFAAGQNASGQLGLGGGGGGSSSSVFQQTPASFRNKNLAFPSVALALVGASDPVMVSGGVSTGLASASAGLSVAGTLAVGGLTVNGPAAFTGNVYIPYAGAIPGSVPRNLISRLTDFVTVKDFGALGDGRSDDTNAVQTAIYAAAAAGVTLCVPPGTYRIWYDITVNNGIPTPLVIPSSLHMIGSPGGGATITWSHINNARTPQNTCACMTTQDLLLNGAHASDIFISDMSFASTAENVAWLWQGRVASSSFIRCNFDVNNTAGGNELLGSGVMDLTVGSGNNWYVLIENCNFTIHSFGGPGPAGLAPVSNSACLKWTTETSTIRNSRFSGGGWGVWAFGTTNVYDSCYFATNDIGLEMGWDTNPSVNLPIPHDHVGRGGGRVVGCLFDEFQWGLYVNGTQLTGNAPQRFQIVVQGCIFSSGGQGVNPGTSEYAPLDSYDIVLRASPYGNIGGVIVSECIMSGNAMHGGSWYPGNGWSFSIDAAWQDFVAVGNQNVLGPGPAMRIFAADDTVCAMDVDNETGNATMGRDVAVLGNLTAPVVSAETYFGDGTFLDISDNPVDFGYDIVVLAGASNMVGLSGSGADPRLDWYDPNTVSQLSQEVVTAGNVYAAMDPLDHVYAGSGNVYGSGGGSIGMSFARAYATILKPGRKILLVPCACANTGFLSTGTTSYAAWAPTSSNAIIANWLANVPGNLLDNAIRRTNLAMAYHPIRNPYPAYTGTVPTAWSTQSSWPMFSGNVPPPPSPTNRLAAILWHQGESDMGTSEASYKANLTSMIAAMRAGVTTMTTMPPFVCGLPSSYDVTNNPSAGPIVVLPQVSNSAYLGGGLGNVGFASSDGLPFFNQTYFTAAGLRAYGLRYFSTYSQVVGGTPVIYGGNASNDGRGGLSWSANDSARFVDVYVNGALVAAGTPGKPSAFSIPTGSMITTALNTVALIPRNEFGTLGTAFDLTVDASPPAVLLAGGASPIPSADFGTGVTVSWSGGTAVAFANVAIGLGMSPGAFLSSTTATLPATNQSTAVPLAVFQGWSPTPLANLVSSSSLVVSYVNYPLALPGTTYSLKITPVNALGTPGTPAETVFIMPPATATANVVPPTANLDVFVSFGGSSSSTLPSTDAVGPGRGWSLVPVGAPVSISALQGTAGKSLPSDRGFVLGGNGALDIDTGYSLPVSYTKAAWVLFANLQNTQHVLSSYGTGGTGGGTAHRMYYDSTTNRFAAGHTIDAVHSTIAANAWTHVCVTYDNTSTIMNLYVNGSWKSGASLVAPWLGGTPVSVGGFADTTMLWWTYVDNARIYSRALSPTEVSNIYTFEKVYTGAGAAVGVPQLLSVSVSPISSNFSGGLGVSWTGMNVAYVSLQTTATTNLRFVDQAWGANLAIIPPTALMPNTAYTIVATPYSASGLRGTPVTAPTASTLALPTAPFVPSPPTANIIAHVPFGLPLPQAEDVHGYAITYTVSNPLANTAERGYALAPYPDASNPSFADLAVALPASYTKACWVFLGSNAAGQHVLSSNVVVASSSHYMYFDGTNVCAGHGSASFAVSSPMAVGTWTHVAVTFDQPTTTMYLYVNGAHASLSAAVALSWTGSGIGCGVELGGLAGNTTTVMTSGGYVGSTRIYGRALSASEVSNLYTFEATYPKTGKYVPPAAVLANVSSSPSAEFGTGVAVAWSGSANTVAYVDVAIWT